VICANGSIYDLKLLDIYKQEVDISQYRGKFLLIVNVASYCGYTNQYVGLQKLYTKYKDKGLEILAFPCNQFGQQEPGTNKEIHQFCTENYGVTFKIMDKVDVNGIDASPIYKIIKSAVNIKEIQWNFGKFLINRQGGVEAFYNSGTTPERIGTLIQTYLDTHKDF